MERNAGVSRAGARLPRSGTGFLRFCGILLTAAALAAIPALADRTPLKPGWNLFSPEQDIELGRRISRDAERQLPMLNDARVDDYLNALGHRLSAHAPGYHFAFQYKTVNRGEINAFALPGGFIYVNRGVIEVADNEAQLAAVMAHETSHVVLRHGTNQASKAYAAQVPLAVLGGMLGGNTVGALLGQMGAGFALNSIFLKYSRTDETEADVMGTQIMYDTAYDPRAMAQFFEKIQAESKSRTIEFFSDHPNPEHRVERVNEEIDKLGGPPANYKTDSADFQAIKRYLRSLPPPPKGHKAAEGGGGSPGQPAPPSSHFRSFENSTLRLQYPDNWRSYRQGNALTFAPDGGLVDNGQGGSSLAYGLIVNVFEPHFDKNEEPTVEKATDELVEQLRRSNPHMNLVRGRERMRMAGSEALSSELTNDSPAGGRETDWLVTTLRPDGLHFFVFVAPQSAADVYQPAFEKIIDSVRFAN